MAGLSVRVIRLTGIAVVAAGVAVGVLRFVNGLPPERDLEGALAAFALGSVIAAVGVLGLLGLAGRPALLLPAAFVLVPLAFLSFAGVLLPLLIPAFVLFRAYERRSPAATARSLVAAGVTIVLLLLAVAALLLRDDPRSWTTSTGGYSTSDVVTPAEALASLAATATAVAAGWSLSPKG